MISWPWKWRLCDARSSPHLEGPQCLHLQGQTTWDVWMWRRRLYDHSKCLKLLTQQHSTTFQNTWIFSLVKVFCNLFPNREHCQHSVHCLWRNLLNAILFWNTRHTFSVSSINILVTTMFEDKSSVMLLCCWVNVYRCFKGSQKKNYLTSGEQWKKYKK